MLIKGASEEAEENEGLRGPAFVVKTPTAGQAMFLSTALYLLLGQMDRRTDKCCDSRRRTLGRAGLSTCLHADTRLGLSTMGSPKSKRAMRVELIKLMPWSGPAGHKQTEHIPQGDQHGTRGHTDTLASLGLLSATQLAGSWGPYLSPAPRGSPDPTACGPQGAAGTLQWWIHGSVLLCELVSELHSPPVV